MKRRTYKSDINSMNKEQLKEWIEEKTDIMMQVGDTGGSTPLLTKIIYAKRVLEKKS